MGSGGAPGDEEGFDRGTKLTNHGDTEGALPEGGSNSSLCLCASVIPCLVYGQVSMP